jgi:hypothetical protein
MNLIAAALLLGLNLDLIGQVCPAAEASSRAHLSISVTNNYGDVFTNLVVAKVLGDGLVLEHQAGQLKVKYADLPLEVREKYEPLAAAASARDTQDAAGNAAYLAVQRQAQAEQARLNALREKNQPPRLATPISKLRIDVFKQGWAITVLNPGLREVSRRLGGAQFAYQAISPSGFNLSVFVEAPAGSGLANRDVFDYYWAKTSRNPLIDERSIRIETLARFVKVSYTSLNIPNVNYYFAFKGRWVDVHISKSHFISGDDKFLADFEEALSYGG